MKNKQNKKKQASNKEQKITKAIEKGKDKKRQKQIQGTVLNPSKKSLQSSNTDEIKQPKGNQSMLRKEKDKQKQVKPSLAPRTTFAELNERVKQKLEQIHKEIFNSPEESTQNSNDNDQCSTTTELNLFMLKVQQHMQQYPANPSDIQQHLNVIEQNLFMLQLRQFMQQYPTHPYVLFANQRLNNNELPHGTISRETAELQKNNQQPTFSQNSDCEFQENNQQPTFSQNSNHEFNAPSFNSIGSGNNLLNRSSSHDSHRRKNSWENIFGPGSYSTQNNNLFGFPPTEKNSQDSSGEKHHNLYTPNHFG